MELIITPKEAMERGIWEELCHLKKINPWAVNESQMLIDEEVRLSPGEAKALGITGG